MKIIGLAGRKGSGKTELARISYSQGFKILRFAFPLKCLVSKVTKLEVTDDPQTKYWIIDKKLTEDQLKLIADETEIPLDFVKDTIGDVHFVTIRHMLQVIGTDLIRKYNPNWHIKKLEASLVEGQNYCVDDVRFPNEFEMLKNKGASLWFVVRPTLDDISNHESETSLRWQDFGDHIIINNVPLANIKNRWYKFLFYCILTDYKTKTPILDAPNYIILRERLIEQLDKHKGDIEAIAQAEDVNKDVLGYYFNMLMIPTIKWKTDPNQFLNDFPFKDDKTLRYKDGFLSYKDLHLKGKKRVEITDNPLIIENVKFFL